MAPAANEIIICPAKQRNLARIWRRTIRAPLRRFSLLIALIFNPVAIKFRRRNYRWSRSKWQMAPSFMPTCRKGVLIPLLISAAWRTEEGGGRRRHNEGIEETMNFTRTTEESFPGHFDTLQDTGAQICVAESVVPATCSGTNFKRGFSEANLIKSAGVGFSLFVRRAS